MSIDSVAMTPPEDPRVGPHPFIGRSDRWCELPGCNRPDRNTVHVNDATPGLTQPIPALRYLALVEAAKAVVREGLSSSAHILLEQALTALGHGRPPYRAERALAEVDRLRRDDPDAYRALGQRIASDIVTKPEHRLPSLMQMLPESGAEPERTPDGTTAVLDDYQHRGQ